MSTQVEHQWDALMRRASGLKVPQSQLLATFCASLFTKTYLEFCEANAWLYANQFQEILAKLWAGCRDPHMESAARVLIPDVDAFEAVEASYACNAGIVLALATASKPDASECVQYVCSTADLMSDFRPEIGQEAVSIIEEAIQIVTASEAEASAELKELAEQNQL